MDTETLLHRTTEKYLQSGDFNGLSLQTVLLEGNDADEIQSSARQLVSANQVTVVSSETQPNPHIKVVASEDVEVQLERLNGDMFQICLYPSPEYLKQVVDVNEYRDKPFALRLALGEPQLSYQSFDLSVLENYRNDPRYHYNCDDIHGKICIKDEHYESGSVPERDEVLLETFGFSFDEEINRAVAVFLRYLADLSPEHQQIWNARRLDGIYTLHPDYYRTSILGDWGQGMSVFQAFIEEQHIVNEMCKLMGRTPLFRNEYNENERPREFGFLIRPTLREFNAFILLLDQMLSDNMDKTFFQRDIPLEEDRKRNDGRVEVVQKGTIRLLEEWIKAKVTLPDPEPIDEMIQAFKNVRKLRQQPAHAVRDDEFDQKYLREQRVIMGNVWDAMRTLRLLLANHPNCRGYEVPTYIQDGKVWTR